MISQVRARIEEAYEVLKTPESRRKYRESIYDSEQLRSFYELQLRKAEIAIRMRMDPRSALALGKSAIEVKPNSSQARLVLAEAHLMLGNLSEARINIRMVVTVPGHLQEVLKDLKTRIG